MLLQVLDDGTLKNMHVTYFPGLVRFFPAIECEDGALQDAATMSIAFKPIEGSHTSIAVPLRPDTDSLTRVDVNMHGSPTEAYDMGKAYNDWFSECLGHRVIFAYIGSHTRQVLMSVASAESNKGTWTSSIADYLPSALSSLVQGQREKIGFADCAPYLVVSNTSLDNVSSRLSDGSLADIQRFRPNIVVEGAETPWEEDFWAQLDIGNVTLDLIHNCVRCKSLNIDYETGKPGLGESGQVFKKLQSDRRVDKAAKYSPVFGRYSFLHGVDQGKVVSIGDEVKVVRRNKDRTVFDWPGLV